MVTRHAIVRQLSNDGQTVIIRHLVHPFIISLKFEVKIGIIIFHPETLSASKNQGWSESCHPART
jgi:hypothetical protein